MGKCKELAKSWIYRNSNWKCSIQRTKKISSVHHYEKVVIRIHRKLFYTMLS